MIISHFEVGNNRYESCE